MSTRLWRSYVIIGVDGVETRKWSPTQEADFISNHFQQRRSNISDHHEPISDRLKP